MNDDKQSDKTGKRLHPTLYNKTPLQDHSNVCHQEVQQTSQHMDQFLPRIHRKILHHTVLDQSPFLALAFLNVSSSITNLQAVYMFKHSCILVPQMKHV